MSNSKRTRIIMEVDSSEEDEGSRTPPDSEIDPDSDDNIGDDDDQNENGSIDGGNSALESEADGMKHSKQSPGGIKYDDVYIASKWITEIGWENICLITLPSPLTSVMEGDEDDMKTLALDVSETVVKKDAPFLFEVLSMDTQAAGRSWFIDENVMSKGGFITFTPMDPLFVLIAVLMKTEKCAPLEEQLEEYFPRDIAQVFARRVPSEQVELVAKKTICQDITAYRFSKLKTIRWLSMKASKISSYFKSKNISASETCVSANFHKTEDEDDKNRSQKYMLYAIDVVLNYIDWTLRDEYKIEICKGHQIEGVVEIQSDKVAGPVVGQTKEDGSVLPVEDYGSNGPAAIAKKDKGSAKQRDLAKAAKGTPSLFKFFGLSSKKP